MNEKLLAAALQKLTEGSPEYCLLWIDWWPLCMQKSEWASWIQAFGSIAAIWFALRIARRQVMHQRESDRERAGEALAELLFGAIRAVRTLNQYIGTGTGLAAIAGRGTGHGYVAILSDLMDALLAVELSALPPQTIRVAMNARQMTRQYLDNLEGALASVRDWQGDTDARYTAAQLNVERQLQTSLDDLRQLLPSWKPPLDRPLASLTG